jgi:hypothetical protein
MTPKEVRQPWVVVGLVEFVGDREADTRVPGGIGRVFRAPFEKALVGFRQIDPA